jgi:hypothetical protein
MAEAEYGRQAFGPTRLAPTQTPRVLPGPGLCDGSSAKSMRSAPLTVLPELCLIHQPSGDYYSSLRAMHDLPREGLIRASACQTSTPRRLRPAGRSVTATRPASAEHGTVHRTRPSASVTRTHTHIMLRDDRSANPDPHQPRRVTTVNRHEGFPFASTKNPLGTGQYQLGPSGSRMFTLTGKTRLTAA